MEQDRVYYFTDASIYENRRTFGVIKVQYDLNNNMYIVGQGCFRCVYDYDIHVLESLAILAAMSDIWKNRYLKGYIITDSNKVYDNIKSMVRAKEGLDNYPRYYLKQQQTVLEKLFIYITEFYFRWPYLIDLQWYCVKSHISSYKQWDIMKKINPGCSFIEAMLLNRGNMIVDDMVKSCTGGEIYNNLETISGYKILEGKPNSTPLLMDHNPIPVGFTQISKK